VRTRARYVAAVRWGLRSVIAADPGARQLVLQVVLDRSSGAMNLRGLDDAGDPADLAVEIASTLQDHVMDNLNTTWPEMTVDGRTVVLEPRLGPGRTPRWEGRGVEHCLFGRLADRLR